MGVLDVTCCLFNGSCGCNVLFIQWELWM